MLTSRSRFLLLSPALALLGLTHCAGPDGRESALSSPSPGPTAAVAPLARADPDALAAGTAAMVARLHAIAATSDPRLNPTADATALIAEYRGLLAHSPGPRDDELRLRAKLGETLLRAGQTAEAIRELETLRSRHGAGTLSPELTRRLDRLLLSAYLRLGEDQNCRDHHTTESCLMPIQGGGRHGAPAGSTAAIALLEQALSRDPDDLRWRWLLNLAHMTLGQYPASVPPPLLIPPAAFASAADIGRFADGAHAAGVAVVGLSGGVVLDDFDGDDRLDLMVSGWGVDEQLRLLINDGDGRFSDRTAEFGLTGLTGGLNLVQADYDNDGWVDVLVLRGAWLGAAGRQPNSLLRNLDGRGFADVTEAAGLLSLHPTGTAAWADFDGDGRVDLFIGNESTPGEFHPCELFRNQGGGRFDDVAAVVGLAQIGFVKGAVWGDYDNDGRPDLYLSQYGEPNLLFHNDGPDAVGVWSFTEVGAVAGVREPLRSFPTWFFDYDNDGWEDLLVASFSGWSFDGQGLAIVAADYLGLAHAGDRVHLYRNDRDGTFRNVAAALSLDRPLLAMGGNFGDLDNDGFLDCYFGTGDPDLATLVPNRMFRNDGGNRFQDVTSSGGFGHLQKGHGIAFGDVDDDGDQDVYAVLGGAFAGDVYPNALFMNPGHGNAWLKLRLEGTVSNRSAIGARIAVEVATEAGPRWVHRTVGSGGSFGASPLRQEVGLGAGRAIRSLTVRWPGSGRVQRFADVPINRSLIIREGDSRVAIAGDERAAIPF